MAYSGNATWCDRSTLPASSHGKKAMGHRVDDEDRVRAGGLSSGSVWREELCPVARRASLRLPKVRGLQPLVEPTRMDNEGARGLARVVVPERCGLAVHSTHVPERVVGPIVAEREIAEVA